MLSTPERLSVPLSRVAPFGLSCSAQTKGVRMMIDVILIGIAVVFFALCFAYTQACDRL